MLVSQAKKKKLARETTEYSCMITTAHAVGRSNAHKGVLSPKPCALPKMLYELDSLAPVHRDLEFIRLDLIMHFQDAISTVQQEH